MKIAILLSMLTILILLSESLTQGAFMDSHTASGLDGELLIKNIVLWVIHTFYALSN
jgi:hypothetical protein